MLGITKGDLRTVTGCNIALVRVVSGEDPLSASSWKVKNSLMKSAVDVPGGDVWRVSYLAKLLTERGEASYRVEDSAVLRLTALIDSLCTN